MYVHISDEILNLAIVDHDCKSIFGIILGAKHFLSESSRSVIITCQKFYSKLMATKENPEKSAGILSLLSFWWVQKLFTAGNDHPLTEEDVDPIETRLHCERLTALLEQ